MKQNSIMHRHLDLIREDEEQNEETMATALPVGTHARGTPSHQVLTEDGDIVCQSVIARPQLASRVQTYDELFFKLGDGSYQCLAPNCKCPSGRIVKMSDGFGNFFKHLALWHAGEVTSQDLSAATQLSLTKGTTKAAVSELGSAARSGVLTITDAFAGKGAGEREASRNAAAVAARKAMNVRVEKALVAMVVRGNRPFAIAKDDSVKDAFASLLEVEADSLKFPSIRTLVRRVDAQLDADERTEHFRVKQLLRDVALGSTSVTHDIWTSPSNQSFEAVTVHLVAGGKLLELAGGVQPTAALRHG